MAPLCTLQSRPEFIGFVRWRAQRRARPALQRLRYRELSPERFNSFWQD
jgi:uncharacterized protein YjiS (DUF1127 family)